MMDEFSHCPSVVKILLSRTNSCKLSIHISSSSVLMSPSLSKVIGGLEVELDFAGNFFLFHGSLHQIEGQMISWIKCTNVLPTIFCHSTWFRYLRQAHSMMPFRVYLND